jgi:hypothetical protein
VICEATFLNSMRNGMFNWIFLFINWIDCFTRGVSLNLMLAKLWSRVFWSPDWFWSYCPLRL